MATDLQVSRLNFNSTMSKIILIVNENERKELEFLRKEVHRLKKAKEGVNINHQSTTYNF